MEAHLKKSLEMLDKLFDEIPPDELLNDFLKHSENASGCTVDEFFGTDQASVLADKLRYLNSNQLDNITILVDEMLMLNYLNTVKYEDVIAWEFLGNIDDNMKYVYGNLVAIVSVDKKIKFYKKNDSNGLVEILL